VAYRDEWSLRFTNASPAEDHMLTSGGAGQWCGWSIVARIDADNLQKFFFRVPLSATVTRGPGWTELNLYPGASVRANRARNARTSIASSSLRSRAGAVFAAVRAMYGYLDQKARARGGDSRRSSG